MLNKLTKLIPILYRDLSSKGRLGRSYGLWIEIDKNHKDDKGLLAHERVHCRQFIRTLGIHSIMYLVSKKWKYESEVEAFGYSIYYGERTKEDVKYSLETYYEIPRNVMKNYGVDIELAIMEAKKSVCKGII